MAPPTSTRLLPVLPCAVRTPSPRAIAALAASTAASNQAPVLAGTLARISSLGKYGVPPSWSVGERSAGQVRWDPYVFCHHLQSPHATRRGTCPPLCEKPPPACQNIIPCSLFPIPLPQLQQLIFLPSPSHAVRNTVPQLWQATHASDHFLCSSSPQLSLS